MYQYMEYLPKYLQSVKELIAIGDCVDQLTQALEQKAVQTNLNGFFETAETPIISRWEQILGLSTPLNASLSSRRDAIIAKLRTKVPITVNTLKSIIQAYMGLPVDISEADYIVTVKYRGESRIADLAPLYATVYDVIPANLILSISYLYVSWGEVKSTYPTWGNIKQKTWGQIYKGV